MRHRETYPEHTDPGRPAGAAPSPSGARADEARPPSPDRRPTGLYLAVAILTVTVILQSVFIGYLLLGVGRDMDHTLRDLADSPLFQELSKLGAVSPGNTGQAQNTPDPDRFYVPPEWHDTLPPGDDQSPLLAPDEEITIHDLLDIVEQFSRNMDAQLRGLEDPNYRPPRQQEREPAPQTLKLKAANHR